MSEIKKSPKISPAMLQVELERARRIEANLALPADRKAVQSYINELESALSALF